MKAIWKGALSFGLVNIPISLYSGSEAESLNFDLLHEKDHGRISYKRFCGKEDREVPYDEIVKGFEYKTGEYVILEDEDFEKANVKKRETVDIFTFVNESEIDTVFFEKPYFLEPQKATRKHYALLRDTLKKSRKVGLAKFVLQNREHLAVIEPKGDALILIQIRYQYELRNIKDLNLPKGIETSKEEREMAQRLINYMTGEFKPKEYEDTYTEDLKEIIAKKARGEKVEARGEKPTLTEAYNLKKMLKESLQKAKD